MRANMQKGTQAYTRSHAQTTERATHQKHTSNQSEEHAHAYKIVHTNAREQETHQRHISNHVRRLQHAHTHTQMQERETRWRCERTLAQFTHTTRS